MRSVGDARRDLGGKHVETLGCQPPSLAHAGEGGRAVNLDLSGLSQRRDRRIDVGHGVLGWPRRKRPGPQITPECKHTRV